jgi:hypothetical protein
MRSWSPGASFRKGFLRPFSRLAAARFSLGIERRIFMA